MPLKDGLILHLTCLAFEVGW